MFQILSLNQVIDFFCSIILGILKLITIVLVVFEKAVRFAFNLSGFMMETIGMIFILFTPFMIIGAIINAYRNYKSMMNE